MTVADSKTPTRDEPVARGEPVIRVSGVVKTFGPTYALKGVDLDVHAGEILGLIGDNGAGKSTLIKTISGFERPDEGTITLHGQVVEFGSPKQARSMGVETVYQEQALCDDLSIVNNLFLGTEVTRQVGPFRFLDTKRMEQEAREMLTDLRLRVDPRQEARFCSGGEKQGVAIARAIHVKAKLVTLMSRPTRSASSPSTECSISSEAFATRASPASSSHITSSTSSMSATGSRCSCKAPRSSTHRFPKQAPSSSWLC